MTNRKDDNKNQIITNINYDQNSLSIFLKTTNNQIKKASDKIYAQMINRHFFGTKYGTKHGTFPQCDLATTRLEMSKNGKVY